MRYVRVPTEVTRTDALSEGACFSPGRYVRFIPLASANTAQFASLDKLVSIRQEVVNTKKSDTYKYAEIGDIDVDTGGVTFASLAGYELPTRRLQRIKQGDVVISTVRTYRKGIGLVMEPDSSNLVGSNAILVLSGVTNYVPGLTLHYIYSFLRTDFFVEQVWSLLNRGVYPRMDTGALNRISIPVSSDARVCKYISVLSEVIAEKEHLIRSRDREILSVIDGELRSGQSRKSFCYNYPSLSEVKVSARLDAAVYSYELKSKKWLIENYKKGYRTPTSAGFSIKPGPSLEIKLLRTRIDSETSKPGFYTLLIPANISEYGTMRKVSWLGTAKKLPLLKRGDILVGEAGFGKGRTIVLIDDLENATTNAHGLYARRSDGNLAESIFFRCIFHWYRHMRLIDLMAVGGSGGHFSPEYFDELLIPNFDDKIKEQIVKLYHSPSNLKSQKVTLDSFVALHRARNKGLGIWELSTEMADLQKELSAAQEKIIKGEPVNVPLA